MNGITLRRAGPADAALVHDLTRRAYAKWIAAMGREPLPMTTDHARAVREDIVDLACHGDELVALVHMVMRPDDMLVENLAVAPAWQGRGLGDALLAHAEAEARQANRPTVRLYTNTLMAGNTAFYASRGYLAERDEPFGNGRRVHMAKSMASPERPA